MAEKKETATTEEKQEKTTKATPAPKTEKVQSGPFAVIATGGKQHVVREGDVFNVEKLPGELKEGSKVEFTEVLLVDDGKTAKLGEPTVSGAKVSAELVENGRDKKIPVIRFRAKSRYFKNRGHRQPYSRVKITKIA